MVDTYQVVLGGIAVSIMVLVPICCIFLWDLLAGRWDTSIKRWREKRAARAAHRQGVRARRTLRRLSAKFRPELSFSRSQSQTATACTRRRARSHSNTIVTELA